MKGGLNGNEPLVEYEDTEEVDVLGVSATPLMSELLESMEIPLLEQGVIKGMTGVMLSEGASRGRNIMSIMVEADPRFPDARAAATLIETFASQCNRILWYQNSNSTTPNRFGSQTGKQ